MHGWMPLCMNTSFIFLFVQLTNIYKNVTILCPPGNLTENNQRGYEITPHFAHVYNRHSC